MEHKIWVVEGVKAVEFVDYAAVARAISRRASENVHQAFVVVYYAAIGHVISQRMSKVAVGEAVACTVHWSNFWLTSFQLQEPLFQYF